MEIAYLADHMIFADDVATWIYTAFIKDVRPGVSYEQVLSKVKACHKSQLPICLIAMVDGKCVGTVSIVQNDLQCRGYTPWLAALYVDQAFRDNKIGEQLVARVKDIVKDLGYREIYLRTEHASDYYRKLGWEFIETCEDQFNLKPNVFKITLDL